MRSYLPAARRKRAADDVLRSLATDEQAAQAPAFFLPWDGESAYAHHAIVRYGDGLYRCIAANGVQPNPIWTPDASPSLWVRIADPAEEWPAWAQPKGSTDAYDKDMKVTHDGKRWQSNIDANTAEPGADEMNRWWREIAI